MHRWVIRAVALLSVLAALSATVAMAWMAKDVNRAMGGEVREVDAADFAVASSNMAISGVSVLAPDGATMLADQVVLVSAGVIEAVGRDLSVPEGYTVVDGRGRFLIPGLIDGHVHLRRQVNDLLLYVANGVTYVRDFAGSPTDLSWRAQIRSGRVGPGLYVTSPILFTDTYARGLYQAFNWPRRNVRSADRAAVVVDEVIDEGYDAIKIYEDTELDTFEALNNVAMQRGIHTVGHLPRGYALDDLGTTNLREIAHIEELVKALQAEFRAMERDDYFEAFPAYVAERSNKIIDDLLARRVVVNTTLWIMESIERQAFELTELLKEVELAHANPAMVEGDARFDESGWLPGNNKFETDDDLTEERREWIRSAWQTRFAAHEVLFKALIARGVTLVAGTDASSHLVIAGFSMHDELAALVRYGMTPQQALAAATTVPARLMGLQAGAILPGYRADLLLLSEDPLQNIEHTRAIAGVVLAGRWLPRTRLDQMLAAVAAANAESRVFDLKPYR